MRVSYIKISTGHLDHSNLRHTVCNHKVPLSMLYRYASELLTTRPTQ